MRIAVFCPSYGQIGGIERKAEMLIAEFRRRGHVVSVLARGPSGMAVPGGEATIFRSRFRGRPRRFWPFARFVLYVFGFPASLNRLRRATADFRADVVLSLTVSTFAPYACGLARTIPLVLSLEGREAGGVFTATPRSLRRALLAASQVIGCSTALATSARALAPEASDRICFVPNGVDATRFGPGQAWQHPRPYLLAVGRLTPQKGFDLLLEAFSRLTPRDLDLLIAGEGPERQRLTELAAQLGLLERVHLLGARDEAEVASLYRGALIAACPSRWEGMPLTCLEAMAAGCPVVAAAVDGLPDLVVHNESGLLVPPEDATALAAAIDQLLDDPQRRRRLAELAQRHVREQLTWTQIAERYLAVLESAVEPSSDALETPPFVPAVGRGPA